MTCTFNPKPKNVSLPDKNHTKRPGSRQITLFCFRHRIPWAIKSGRGNQAMNDAMTLEQVCDILEHINMKSIICFPHILM